MQFTESFELYIYIYVYIYIYIGTSYILKMKACSLHHWNSVKKQGRKYGVHYNRGFLFYKINATKITINKKLKKF